MGNSHLYPLPDKLVDTTLFPPLEDCINAIAQMAERSGGGNAFLGYALGNSLSLKTELCRLKCMLLGHGCFGSVEAIKN